ncbi:MAG TPA: cobalamin-dependent protein [Thermoanaerobaculia bacterium]|nr:cobalamin-dependent protein [Thermoanaerobaculia bacterium]
MIEAHGIRTHLEELASAITDRHFAAHPELLARYPAVGRQRCLEDARFHLQYLASALDAGSSAIFLDYIAWAKVMLATRNVPANDLAENLRVIEGSLTDMLGAGSAVAVRYIESAIEALPSMPDGVPSHLDPRAPLWASASEYLNALLHGSRADAMRAVTAALDGGASIREVYRHVFEPAQQEIGRLWQLNQISVAQEHYCTAATQHIMTQLYGYIFGGEKRDSRAVAMCVGGELHEVGLRIITDLLELDGWQTWYLGASVPPASAVQLCVEQRADVLLVSATLPPHIASVAEVIRSFRARPELGEAKVIVGGRAFRTEPEVWRTIGADAFASNADECLALIDRLTA